MQKKYLAGLGLLLLLCSQLPAQPAASALEETGPMQRRDLSMPGSPIVVNPFDFRLATNQYPSVYSNNPEMPLHFAYLCNKRVSREAKDVLTLYHIDETAQPVTAWTGATNSLAGWSNPDEGNGASLTVVDGQLRYTVANSYHAFTNTQPVQANLGSTPTIRIAVTEATVQWSIKVTDGVSEVALKPDGNETGTFYYNIPATTGWTGNKQFTIKIFAINYGGVADGHIRIGSIALTAELSQRTAWTGNLTDVTQWVTIGGGTLQSNNQGLKFTAGNSLVGFRTKNMVQANLDRTPKLLLSVPDAIGQWALKINDGGNDISIRGDARGLGIFEYDLKAATGWSGTKTFNLVFYSIGNNASYSHLLIGDVRVVGYSGTPAIQGAASFSTSWRPYDLPFSAVYADNAGVNGKDYFFDGHTLIRELAFTQAGKMVLAGYYTGGLSFANDSTLVVNRDGYAYAISTGAFDPQQVRFYTNILDLKGRMNAAVNPPPTGYWAVVLNTADLSGANLRVAVSVVNATAAASLPGLVQQALTGNNAATAYQSRKDEMDTLLHRVPRPESFTLTKAPDLGVTAAAVEKEYYKAWVFLASNLLEAEGSIFPYPQLAAGKPSIWDEGDADAPFSATWESLLGLQFYGFIDPTTAWQGFKGIMSLTDNNGVIGGESLPSRKAQTAWMLYQQTGDSASLAQVYAPLERYLNWRLQYPHWIYFSNPDPNQKDAEFVFHALVDLSYMEKIAGVVKTSTEVNAWHTKAQLFATQAQSWFWPSPTAIPYQTYNTASQNRQWGNTPWVTIGLYSDLFTGSYLEGLKQRFNNDFSSVYNFYLPGIPKYPDLSYTIYGLVKRGMTAPAETLVDAGIRDIVRSAMFAEFYEETGSPYPKGVRPSLFGACTIIDLVWLKNGFQYDKGAPHAVNIFAGSRSVSNIRYHDKKLTIAASDNQFSFSGSLLQQPYTKTLTTGEVIPVELPEPPQEPEDGDKLSTTSLLVFPNPSDSQIQVAINLNAQQTGAVFYLYTLNGILVHTQQFRKLAAGPQQFTIDPPGSLSKGAYVYRFRAGKKQYQGMLIRN